MLENTISTSQVKNMNDTFFTENALPFVLKFEGTLVRDEHNRGGAFTSMGINSETYNTYRYKINKPALGLEFMSPEEAVAIYYHFYWESALVKCNIGRSKLVVFDTLVNMGSTTCKKLLEIVNGNANLILLEKDIEQFLNLRLERYTEISKDPSQEKYLLSWTKRVKHLLSIKAENTFPDNFAKGYSAYGEDVWEPVNKPTPNIELMSSLSPAFNFHDMVGLVDDLEESHKIFSLNDLNINNILNPRGIILHQFVNKFATRELIEDGYEQLGWSAPPYHAIILNGYQDDSMTYDESLDGKIIELRPDYCKGSHCKQKGLDHYTLGVALVGEGDSNPKKSAFINSTCYSDKQVQSLISYLTLKSTQYGMDELFISELDGESYPYIMQHSDIDDTKKDVKFNIKLIRMAVSRNK